MTPIDLYIEQIVTRMTTHFCFFTRPQLNLTTGKVEWKWIDQQAKELFDNMKELLKQAQNEKHKILIQKKHHENRFTIR